MPEELYGLFLLLGGIGLFLYGINYTSKSLENAVGDKLRILLEKMSGKWYYSFLCGLLVTVLIQSSGATSVIIIGFVGAGMMSLDDAIFAMLGANIGTTVTSQIIAFKIDSVAPLILFIGVLLVLFFKNRHIRNVGSIILGFGLLFVGILIMGMSVSKLPLTDIIEDFVGTIGNPVLLLIFGTVITAAIQSSSASIGILQVLVSSTAATSVIGLSSLEYIIIGMNIGAVAPMLIMGFSGNKKAKRAAVASLLTKAIGALIFIVIMLAWSGLSEFIIDISPEGDVSRQIANFHFLFNIVSNILLMPFVRPLAAFIKKMSPDSALADYTERKLLYLESDTILNPSIAVAQVKKETVRMAHIADANINLALESFFEKDMEKAEIVFDTEKTVNFLNHEITGFLVKLHGKKLSESEIAEAGIMLRVVADIERIGDHAENIAEYANELERTGAVISDSAMEELKTISYKMVEVLDLAIQVYEKNLFERLDEVSTLEEEVDVMQETYVENHIKRLKQSECDPRGGVIFTDMTTNVERCSDHAINIAYAINGENTTVAIKKTYVVTRDMNGDD